MTRTTVFRIVRQTATGLVFTGIVVVLMLWLFGVFHPKIDETQTVAPAERPARGVATATVTTMRVPRVESAVGTIQAVHETQVASKILARVVAVHVRAGQRVHTDDVLVELDDADLRARVEQAEAAVDAACARRDQARIELERVERLAREGHAAPIELDRARNAFKAAEAELQRAEQALAEARAVLDYATVRSPIDGIVVDKRVEVGDTVTPGQVLVTLYDPTRMQLVASVRESLAHRLDVGQPIDVRIDAIGKTCQGSVSEIVPEAQTASRTFAVKVTGPCPPNVYTGMFGRLLIPLEPQEIVVVPRAALRRIGQLDIVDVVEDGVLRRRAVQLGRRFGDQVEVLSGLRPGEQVALLAEPTGREPARS